MRIPLVAIFPVLVLAFNWTESLNSLQDFAGTESANFWIIDPSNYYDLTKKFIGTISDQTARLEKDSDAAQRDNYLYSRSYIDRTEAQTSMVVRADGEIDACIALGMFLGVQQHAFDAVLSKADLIGKTLSKKGIYDVLIPFSREIGPYAALFQYKVPECKNSAAAFGSLKSKLNAVMAAYR